MTETPCQNVGSGRGSQQGITLLEVLISVGIIGILASLGAEVFDGALERARVSRAIADIRTIEKLIMPRDVDGVGLPATLADLGWTTPDPWGQPYQYMNFALSDPKAMDKKDGKPKDARRDKFLKPLNSSYDLYSNGEDGESKPKLGHKLSEDDVVRAADGAFVGLASDF